MEKSETGDELYFRISLGRVSKTVEITDSMYVDINEAGEVVGVEWINFNECIKANSTLTDDLSVVPEMKELRRRYPEVSERIEQKIQILS